MRIQATSITYLDTLEKIDLLSIEQTLQTLDFPEHLKGFETFYLTVVVRPDELYPLEHYRIGSGLYLTLPLDLDTVRQRSTAEVTEWITAGVADYLPTIETIEEREMQPVDEDWEIGD